MRQRQNYRGAWGRASIPLATLCALLAIVGKTSATSAALDGTRGKAEHVVLIVWDGMRPDFVTEASTPNLWKLAQRGVTFRAHRSIYPTLTSVNVTALATGVYPSRSGIIANYEDRPAIDRVKATRMDAPDTIRKGDEESGARYLSAPTIAELVQANGGRTAVAGTKTASLLFDRQPHGSTAGSVTIFAGDTVPASALPEIVKLLGPFPTAAEIPNASADEWTTRALTEALWNNGVPPFSVLWLSDPDKSQHATAPGNEAVWAGIKSADANLGLLLAALEKKGALHKTDILIASDHGFSTIEHSVDVAALLTKGGFTVSTANEPAAGCGVIRVAGNGGTDLFYVGERDPATAARLVEYLQQSDFAGVIFSREPIDGTFRLSQIHLDSSAAPDVVMSFRWSNRKNKFGVAGVIDANGVGDEGRGSHGTLSPFDLSTTLIAAGPDFRAGITNKLPTANIDLAPTILHILGIKPPQPLDGRVLGEALVNGLDQKPAVEAKTLEATREFPAGVWRQYLRTSKVGPSIYIDEGNGEVRSKERVR